MNVYLVGLLLGAVGFATMAVSGFARHGHGARSGRAHGRGRVFALTSPRFVFSFALGFGLTGLTLAPLVPNLILAPLAVIGGLAFERILVRPLWDWLMRFGSEPALTLESCCGDVATAVTAFDGNGHGIVAMELDGQIVQLLARLASTDRATGVRVAAGARLRIEDVDPGRNRCTVSALA